ncbi:MAG: hypothetical protein Q8Q10_01470 [bacterium]|nr:hypothetical protein [bacterium]
MGKKPSKKLKRKLLPMELIYREVEFDEAALLKLDRAFDILFDEVLRRRGLNSFDK